MTTYFTLTSSGIFHFQRQHPKQILSSYPSIKALFRRSLQTRSKMEARKLSMRISTLLDDIYEKYGHYPEKFTAAINIISKYRSIQSLSWHVVEQYLSELDESESKILEECIQISLKEDNVSQINIPESVPFSPPPDTTFSEKHGGIVKSSITHSGETPEPTSDQISLSESIQRYLDFKQPHIKNSTYVILKTRLQLLPDVLGDKLLNDITQADIREFRDILIKLPKDKRNNRDIPIRKLIKMGFEPISVQTAKTTMDSISSYFIFCTSEGYDIKDNLHKIFQSYKSGVKSNPKTRLPFTPLELQTMIQSEMYKKGKWKNASDYWTPLIGMTSGMRMGEILQLEISDIQKHEGILCFDINDDDGKSVKTKSSKRLVPIHQDILKLGFMDFVQSRRKIGKLFDEKDHGLYSKRFNGFKEKLGISPGKDTRKDFHSFRHTFRTMLVDANIPERIIDGILGHSSGSIGNKVYSHSDMIQMKHKAVNSISFDFGNIKDWKRNRFCQISRS